LRLATAGADIGVPVVKMAADARFTFHLRLHNPSFALFTDTNALLGHAAPVFANKGANQQPIILQDRLQQVTDRFTERQPQDGEKVLLPHQPLDSLTADSFTVSGSPLIAKLKLYDAPSKTIAVNSLGTQKGDSFAVTYAVPPQLPNGIFADIDLYNNNTVPALQAGPAKFQVQFAAKQARWCYYLITDLSDKGFSVRDTGDSPLFSTTNAGVKLSADVVAADPVAQSIAAQYPSMTLWRFISDRALTFTNQSRKSLKLLMDGDAVIVPLPNPALSNLGSVPVDGGDKQNSVYQIVKYFSQALIAPGG
jgi:hypothetical protein